MAGYVARRTGAAEATAAMERAADELGSGKPGVDDEYARALDRWLASGAPDLDERIAPVLADLGLRRRAGRADDRRCPAARRPGSPSRRCC